MAKGLSMQVDKKHVQRLIVFLLLLGLTASFKILGLGHYLSLNYLKESQAAFTQLYAAHRPAVIAAYFFIYVIVTGLSLPGAAVMSLAGGALFGLAVATVVISFASSIGAALACLVSRFLLRDWVQKRFGDRLAVINAGIEKEGAYYLFSLRLVPIFPFFIINLVMGLTSMRLSTFYWVSQLGMLPATLVFVNAGRELGRINSLGAVLSPRLIFSFVLLGLFPLIAKKLTGIHNKRRQQRRSHEK